MPWHIASVVAALVLATALAGCVLTWDVGRGSVGVDRDGAAVPTQSGSSSTNSLLPPPEPSSIRAAR